MKKIVIALTVLFALLLQNVYAFNLYAYRASKDYEVVVLMYHKLSEDSKEWSDYCVSPELFESDIKYFKENGYTFKKASELAKHMTKKGDKIVCITFDDGYMSDYKYALPILEKYKVSASFYVIGSFIGKSDYMGVDEIKKLSASPYAEVGNHSYDMHNFTRDEIIEKNKNDLSFVLNDYKKCTETLEKITGKKVRTLTFPNGLYTNRLSTKLYKDGYFMFSTGTIRYKYGNTEPTGRITRSYNIPLSELLKIKLV